MSDSDRSISPAGAPAPAVCVIIPAYGVNAYIADAVDSVLGQTFTDYEVIVVNDGAPPAETAELRAIMARYGERVRYMEQENGGQSAARNMAMRATRARLVAFLDGDDYWAPTLLEREMALFAADPGLALVYADAWLFGEGPHVGETFMRCIGDSRGPVTLESLLVRTVNVTMSTVVARRDAVLGAGAFDESLRYAEDLELWLRMAHAGGRMTYLREPLAYKRLRPTSLSADSLTMETTVVEVLEEFGRRHQLSGSSLVAWRESIARARSLLGVTAAKVSLVNGRPANAVESLQMVRRRDASWKLLAAHFGLRTMPVVMSALYRGWTRLLDARGRRAVAGPAALGAAIPRPGAAQPAGPPAHERRAAAPPESL